MHRYFVWDGLFIMRILIHILILLPVYGQTIERPVDRPASLKADLDKRLAAAATEMKGLHETLNDLKRRFQANPGNSAIKLQIVGQTVLITKKEMDVENIHIDSLLDFASTAEGLAADLQRGGRDVQLEQQANYVAAELDKARERLAKDLQAAQNFGDQESKSRLANTVIDFESLQRALQLFENSRAKEGNALEARSRRARNLRDAAGLARSKATEHRYEVLNLKAALSSEMVDFREVKEDIDTGSVLELIKSLIGPGRNQLNGRKALALVAPADPVGRAQQLLAEPPRKQREDQNK